MKILLLALNAKYIHSNPAVYSLRACAARQGFSTELLEFTVNQREDEILRALYRKDPMCWQFPYIYGMFCLSAACFGTTGVFVRRRRSGWEDRKYLMKAPLCWSGMILQMVLCGAKVKKHFRNSVPSGTDGERSFSEKKKSGTGGWKR